MVGKWFMVITLRSPLGKYFNAPATIVRLFVSFHFNTDWSIGFPSSMHIITFPHLHAELRAACRCAWLRFFLGFIRLNFWCKVVESLHITQNASCIVIRQLLSQLSLQWEENNMLFHCGNPYLETKDCVNYIIHKFNLLSQIPYS